MDLVQLCTPLGSFRAYVEGGKVREARFVNGGGSPRAEDTKVADALSSYFAGEVDVLDSVAVDAVGTSFQQRVWAALRTIPAGETASYAEIAAVIGAPGAARAVGSANASNPVGVIVPCHRVVRSDGAIGGYGFGVDRKRWLLEHEGAIQPANRLLV
ncbi:MAG: methylated-DNA--[protein]-cysteine S-methyltransferase [Actinomycetota bacterium]